MINLLAVALLASGYVCKELPKVPGSTYQQIFEINNSNQIAAGSDSGAVIYSRGRWSALPAPSNPDYTAPNMGALGINDAGDVAGGAANNGGFTHLFSWI